MRACVCVSRELFGVNLLCVRAPSTKSRIDLFLICSGEKNQSHGGKHGEGTEIAVGAG